MNRLLELLRAGGTHLVVDLARELETTPALVEAMLDDLERMGYLKRLGGECGEGCSECSLAGSCAAGNPSASLRVGGGRVWTLRE